MTTLVDVSTEDGNLADLDKEIAEAAAARRAAADDGSKQKAGNADVDPALPPKLRGKSLAELAEMYQNLESEHGRMGNELGNMRQLADRLLEVKRAEDLGRAPTATKQPAKVEVTAAELLEKPTEALDRYTSSRESAVESRLNDRLTRIEQNVLATSFASRHPDSETVAKSPEFTAWVKQSRVRQRAAASAAAGDFTAADDLLTEYKAQRDAASRTENRQTNQAADLEAARRASLESGSSKAGAGSERQVTGKIYSRAAIMKLRLQDPEKYYSDEYQGEIMAAYNEGRVK